MKNKQNNEYLIIYKKNHGIDQEKSEFFVKLVFFPLLYFFRSNFVLTSAGNALPLMVCSEPSRSTIP